jgi:hypothetical protein
MRCAHKKPETSRTTATSRCSKRHLAAAQTPREPHREAGQPPRRTPPVQSQDRPRLPPERRFPVLLGLRLPLLGGEVPRSMVHPNHALASRAHEKSRTHPAPASPPHYELVSRQRRLLQWHRRGLQHQSKTDHQKSLRLHELQNHSNRLISYTWRFTRAQLHPQILLRSQNCLQKLEQGLGRADKRLQDLVRRGRKRVKSPPDRTPHKIQGSQIILKCETFGDDLKVVGKLYLSEEPGSPIPAVAELVPQEGATLITFWPISGSCRAVPWSISNSILGRL